MGEVRSIASFAAANTPMGFFSYFDSLQNPQEMKKLYLIKGGPGTGKSTFMEQIAEDAEENNLSVERIYCSADPSSLDGVVVGNGLFAVLDATAPHAMEPICPGAFEEILDLSCYLRADRLEEKREELLKLKAENKALHQKTAGILSAAASLKQDSIRLGNQALLWEKIQKYAGNHLPVSKGSQKGKMHRRFLTAVFGESIRMRPEVRMQSRACVVIKDKIGSAASVLLRFLSEACVQAGAEVYAYFCPLAPTSQIEHLYLPEQGIFYTTSNTVHPFNDAETHKTIHAERFYDLERLEPFKGRLKFNQQLIGSLTAAAAENEQKALSVHDAMEAIYRGAVLRAAQNKKMHVWRKKMLNSEEI